MTSPLLHIRQTGSFLQFVLTSSPLNSDGRAPTIHIDEPFTALQTDGLPPTICVDEPFKQKGSLLLFTLTSPSLHFRQTGSLLQFTLTSRFTALLIDELLPIIHKHELFQTALPDELLLFTWTSSHNSLPDELFQTALPDELLLFTWTSSHNSLPDELVQTALPDDLSPLTHVAELYSTTHTDEPSPTVPKDELYSPPTLNDLSSKQDAQLKSQISIRKSVNEGHRPNPMSSTYSNHSVWESGQFKQNSIQNFNDTV